MMYYKLTFKAWLSETKKKTARLNLENNGKEVPIKEQEENEDD